MGGLLGPTGLPVARVFGIEVRIHVTWVVILAVVAFATAGQLGLLQPELTDAARWVVGSVMAVLFLVSVVVHELAHAVVARRRGLAVNAVTLLFFGGITSVSEEATTARDEAAIAAAGPLVSLGIGAVLTAIGWPMLPGGSTLGLALVVLGAVNLLLGLLNFIPALPLDGGRVLRAVIWQVTGDARRALRLSAVAGRAFGYLVILAGLALSLAGDGFNGVVAVISGWFLINGARALDRRATVEALIDGLRVDEVMERDFPTVGPALTLDTFAAQYLASGTSTTLPVIRGETLLGVIGVSQLRRVGRRRWPNMRAEDLMVSPPTLPFLAPGDKLWAGLEALRRSGLDGLPVMAGQALQGMLTRRAVVAAIQAKADERVGPTAS